ncbi:uncharacterized protein [Scyliorhinus torazame]|uniref:uncharacterized protein n=1 Tax=Scyliorhinus torazame TaxID=75743 RepID=UPI003B5B5840
MGCLDTHTIEFEQFVHILNNHHASIKIKVITHEHTIDFLDTTVYKVIKSNGEYKLATKVFFKPTDTHALLHTNSHHPKHVFRGLIKSQLTRFHRICSENSDFETAVHTLFTALQHRGYTKRFLRYIKSNFLTELQNPSGNKNLSSKIPFVIQYNSKTTQINKLIKKHFEKLKQDVVLLTQWNIVTAYKRNKNLKDLLVKTKLPLEEKYNCGRTNCTSCKFFKITSTIHNSRSGKVATIKQKITCQHKNLVYVIRCKRCDILYIGETGNTLRTRLTGHCSEIRTHKRHKLINIHFMEHGLDALQIIGLEANSKWSTPRRKRRERHWIINLGTKSPNGLN